MVTSLEQKGISLTEEHRILTSFNKLFQHATSYQIWHSVYESGVQGELQTLQLNTILPNLET